jgi:hypothetical protein
MSKRAPDYGPGLRFLITFRRLKRRLTRRSRLSQRKSEGLILGLFQRIFGLFFLMLGGAFLALAISIFLGSFSSFFFVIGGVLFGAGIWFFGGMRRPRPLKSPARPALSPTKKIAGAPKPMIKDPRWTTVRSLLGKTRKAADGEERILEAAKILEVELESRFREKQAFSASELGAISANSADVDQHQVELESRIVEGLETLKKLHMTAMKLEKKSQGKNSDSDSLADVLNIMAHIDAEQEVESGLCDLSDLENSKLHRGD